MKSSVYEDSAILLQWKPHLPNNRMMMQGNQEMFVGLPIWPRPLFGMCLKSICIGRPAFLALIFLLLHSSSAVWQTINCLQNWIAGARIVFEDNVEVKIY